MSLLTTSSQTIGPFLHIGLSWLVTGNLAGHGVSGQRISVEGRVIDGDGKPVTDGLVEIWQANAHGRYAHPNDTQDKPLEPAFKGFGRMPTDDQGSFRFTTVKPGRVVQQAPHLNVAVFARGMLKQLITRMYFPDDAANAEDDVLERVPIERRATLIAQRISGNDDALRWDVILQGPGETVFFEY